MTKEKFIILCKQTHGNRYDYTDTVFINWRTKISIKCKKHGLFLQDPSSHAHNKNGCPSCGFNTSLAGNLWLNNFKNNNIIKEKVMKIGNKRFKVDGYDPATKTIYEYFGTYWHGHPDRFDSKEIHPVRKITYGELYQETLNKIKHIQDNGYNLIYQWGH